MLDAYILSLGTAFAWVTALVVGYAALAAVVLLVGLGLDKKKGGKK